MCTLQKFKLVFFVPSSALQACKSAIFAAGAGSFPGTGGYTECCFTSKGTGQFRPGDAANPHVSSQSVTQEVNFEARLMKGRLARLARWRRLRSIGSRRFAWEEIRQSRL